MQYTHIPYVQVRHNALVMYTVLDPQPTRRIPEFKKRSYSGAMTPHARKRIKKAVDILIQKNPPRRIWNPVISKFHDFSLAFVTLTIHEPQVITAADAYPVLLKPFLRHFRRQFKDWSYIWKAELQKRGQLHYHLTSNEFMPHDEIRKVWNRLQKRHGLLNTFAAKYRHFNPNSTDVHAVWMVKSLPAYLMKYLSKDGGVTKGKVWDCSKDLKKERFSSMGWCADDKKLWAAAELKQASCEVLKHCTIWNVERPAEF